MRDATVDPNSAGPAIAVHRARVLRPWRWFLLLYAIALTTATHWPRLRLTPEIPASDKMIHMSAFGLLAVLLWRSGLVGPRWLVAIVAVCWAAMDEISQGIPILHRTVTWHDMIANICGVVCAMALLWAMRPTQSPEQLAGPDRVRARLFEFTFDEMFARVQPWAVGAMVAASLALTIVIARLLLPSARVIAMFNLAAAVVALHVLYLLYRRMFFRRLAVVRRECPCLRCGAPRVAAGDHSCGMCRTDRRDSDYDLPPRPSLGAVLRTSAMPMLVAFAGIAAMFAMVLLVPYLYESMIIAPGGANRSLLPRLAQTLGRVPPELTAVVDLTIYVLLLSVVVRIWRRGMAAYIDRSVRCRRCGHDLHGTPINERGEGHCGECGEAFVRELSHRDTEAQRERLRD